MKGALEKALTDKSAKQYFVRATVWHRDWTGSLSRLKPQDIEDDDAAVIVFEDGRAVIVCHNGRSVEVSARKRNWSMKGGLETSRRTFLANLARHERERRAAEIARLSTDWRAELNLARYAPLTESERNKANVARLASFRTAKRPDPHQAKAFLESIDIPADLHPLYVRFVARCERIDLARAERTNEIMAAEAARTEAAAREKAAQEERQAAWREMLTRQRAGEIITATEAGICVQSSVRPSGCPHDLWDAIYQREIRPLKMAQGL